MKQKSCMQLKEHLSSATTVRTISDLGTPDPVKEPEDKKTYLIINANVEPWTVNINDFDL